MDQVKTNHIDNFIAYWVDGIYMKNEFMAFNVVDEFEKAGFPCKIEEITNFKSRFKFNYMEYTYIKEGKEKILNLPIKRVNDTIKKNLLNLVNKYRVTARLDEIDAEPVVSSYVGALSNKPYTQAGLFD